ncbi:MAG: hypothetical protein JRG71_05555 [Deltaproteobacteria bacterium]|nr:hypothetical protein [Deltaproteobacteria bacterium]
MVLHINELSGNTAKFAQYCVEQCSVIDLVSFTRDGIDYDMCYKWGINGEQWQDAIFAALKTLSGK